MPSVQAGNLRHKVALQSQQETRDSTTGEVLVTWQTVANVWAQIVPLSGKEFLAAQ